MTQNATQQGAPEAGAPTKHKAFPDPDIPGGVDNSGEEGEDNHRPLSPRDEMLAGMDDRIDEERQAEIQQNNAELAEAAAAESGQPAESGEDAEPGLQSQEAMHPDADTPEGLPEGLKNDPLAEYIVMNGEEAMFKTKVDGIERLIPLAAARTQLQKHVAAEVRLQQAAEVKKDLDLREETIRTNEAALSERLQKEKKGPPSGENATDASDQGFEDEAREVVSSMFRGTEDEAVENLTALLRKTSQVATPQVIAAEVAVEAAGIVREQRAADDKTAAEAQEKKDIDAGFKKFSEDYPDILGDENLFRHADSLADDIERDNPEWAPSEIMAEAGNRTREWVKSLKGEGKASEQDPDPGNDRRERKRNLKPMPANRSAVQPPADKDVPDTPQSVMQEIRAGRGQPQM